MNNSKSSKEEEFSKENLFDKFIVDPNGNIIGKCVGIVIDKKKKKHLRIAVKTELDSYFEIEQTIPEKLVKQIGEIILLKKEFEIPPISPEDIVTFEIPKETPRSEKQQTQKKEDSISGKETERQLEREQPETGLSKKQIKPSETRRPSNEKAMKKVQSIKTNDNAEKEQSKKSKVKSEESIILDTIQKYGTQTDSVEIFPTTKKDEKLSFKEWFSIINQEKDEEEKEKQINRIIEAIKIDMNLGDKITKLLLEKLETTDLQMRLTATICIEKIIEKFPELIIPDYEKLLLTTYTESNIEIQEQLIKTLTYPLLSRREEIQTIPLEAFFEELIISKSIGKNSHLAKIHKINLKLFANDFIIQQILVCKYLKALFNNQEQNKKYLNYISEFNTFIISLVLFLRFSSDKWEVFFNIDSLTDFFQQSFIDSIQENLQLIDKADISQLNKLTENYYGIKLSKKIVEEIIKRKINEVMTNIDIIPSNILFSYFQKEEEEIRSIIFDLISRKEINVKFAIIDNKEFFKPTYTSK
ncbi:MAG: hypothetical protein GF308_08705 [Candidatus Heimdallarchaeota archaeon]|nr:hypothetical protein [Candidatus Heimdallarchaeota archaeon]